MDTKRKADELTHGMRSNGWPALCIHGDKSQSERNWVMSGSFLIILVLEKKDFFLQE